MKSLTGMLAPDGSFYYCEHYCNPDPYFYWSFMDRLRERAARYIDYRIEARTALLDEGWIEIFPACLYANPQTKLTNEQVDWFLKTAEYTLAIPSIREQFNQLLER